MGWGGTYSRHFKALLWVLTTLALSGCLIDDPPPCTIEDNVAPDAVCQNQDSTPFSFKVDYTTANGNSPSGRYGYYASGSASKSEAEAECKSVLQNVFNTSYSYIDGETAEIQYYRGNICGDGYHLLTGLGQIKVKRVRQKSSHNYDYDLELTCTEN